MSFEEVEKHPAMSSEEVLRLQMALVLQERIEHTDMLLFSDFFMDREKKSVVTLQRIQMEILSKILEADAKAAYVLHVVYGC